MVQVGIGWGEGGHYGYVSGERSQEVVGIENVGEVAGGGREGER